MSEHQRFPSDWHTTMAALQTAFPEGGYGTPIVSYLKAPDDAAAAVRALVEADGRPRAEAEALIAHHGPLFQHAAATLRAESRRTGLGLLELLEAHRTRLDRAAHLSAAKSAFFNDVGLLMRERQQPGDRTLGDLLRAGRIAEEELDALAGAHGLAFDDDGELVGPDGETDAALGITDDALGIA